MRTIYTPNAAGLQRAKRDYFRRTQETESMHAAWKNAGLGSGFPQNEADICKAIAALDMEVAEELKCE